MVSLLYGVFFSFGQSFLLENLSRCKYFIRSYPPIVISYILQIILFPLFPITMLFFIIAMYFQLLFNFLILAITIILLPWYCLSGCIFPKNIELSKAYYRDKFDRNPDLDPPVIIDEMSDKLRNIVDNYRPLLSTTSFDYLRFVKETRRIKYRMSGGENRPDYDVERSVTGSFIKFMKHV